MNRYLLLLLIVLSAAGQVMAQDFERLRQEAVQRQANTRGEIQRLLEQIQRYEQTIERTGTEYERLYRTYEDLRREIALRDEVLRKLDQEQREIQRNLTLTEAEVTARQRELNDLVATYKKQVRHLYMHGRVPELALIMSASSINQMLTRAYYLRRFQQDRTRQADRIGEVRAQLEARRAELIADRQDNQRSLDQSRTERGRMDARRRDQQTTINRLQRDRRRAQQQLDDTRKQIENLNRTLAAAIAEEERLREAEAERIRELEAERQRRLAEAQRITDATRREAEVARYSTPITAAPGTPSAESMSTLEAAFEAQRGRIRWPVDDGAISVGFGTVVDPVYRTRVNNPGIEVATGSRAPVYAVHDGYIGSLGVSNIFGYDNLIILNHGAYKTVYGNLSEVVVANNTYVRQGQLLGYAGTARSAKGESVFFMVKKGQETLDPTQWIQPRRPRTP